MFILVCWLREGRGYVIRSVCLRVISYVSRITAKLTIETSNPATGFRPSLATVVSAEPFSHGTGTLARGACRRKWQLTDTDLCPCGETQTMSHIVESCPLTSDVV